MSTTRMSAVELHTDALVSDPNDPSETVSSGKEFMPDPVGAGIGGQLQISDKAKSLNAAEKACISTLQGEAQKRSGGYPGDGGFLRWSHGTALRMMVCKSDTLHHFGAFAMVPL